MNDIFACSEELFFLFLLFFGGSEAPGHLGDLFEFGLHQAAWSMVSEGEALINSLREEMEKNSQLREQLSKKEQVALLNWAR